MHLAYLVAVVSLLSFVACGSSKDEPSPAAHPEPAAAEPAEPAEPAAAATPEPAAKEAKAAATGGPVELAFRGDLEADIKGAGATCSQIVHDGKPVTTVAVDARSLGAEGDWSLSLIVSSEEEWAAPAVMLNVRGDERASYTYNKTVPSGQSVSVKRDLSGADIDLTLKEIAGKRKVEVEGTLRCPQR